MNATSNRAWVCLRANPALGMYEAMVKAHGRTSCFSTQLAEAYKSVAKELERIRVESNGPTTDTPLMDYAETHSNSDCIDLLTRLDV